MRERSPGGAAGLWAAVTAGCLVLLLWADPVAAGRSLAALVDLAGSARPGSAEGATGSEAALGAFCALVLTGAVSWIWICVSLSVVGVLRGRAERPVGVPRWMHRAVVLACGAALTVAPPALAHDTPASPQSISAAPQDVGAGRLDGLPYPDRAIGGRIGSRSPRTPSVRPPASAHRVGPGESLWSIAAAQLPPGTSPALVTRHWHAIYRANRSILGADPDLVQIGTELHLPPPPHPSR